MYCDFCGRQLSTNVKYCRHCGRMLTGRLEDTRPLPVINDALLGSAKRQAMSLAWSNLLPAMGKTPLAKVRLGRKLYELSAIATLAGLVYVLTAFKNIQQYQILTAVLGVFWAAYSWYKSK